MRNIKVIFNVVLITALLNIQTFKSSGKSALKSQGMHPGLVHLEDVSQYVVIPDHLSPII